MICDPQDPCGDLPATLAPAWPQPGQSILRRRLADYHELLADLVRRSEQRDLGGQAIGRRWDIEGDQHAMNLLSMWAYVGDGLTTYAELIAGEAYLATAQDWLDLARLADQIGYRPSQRVAAEGWVRFETDRLASPMVPAGTKVQASGTPTRGPQTYEVIADTQLDADWANLTATWVPTPGAPTGRTVRFLGDPGFRAGDDVLLIAERAPGPSSTSWLVFWLWLFGIGAPAEATVTPIAVVTVVGRESELGTTLVEFDRDVAGLLADLTTTYAAYRILDKAASARRLSSVLRVPESGAATSISLPAYSEANVITPTSIVLDRQLTELSTESLVAIVRWDSVENQGDVVRVKNHIPIDWEVAPGTPVLASKLLFDAEVGALDGIAGQRDLYVLDRRVVVTHYDFPLVAPAVAPGAGLQLRVWPAPRTTSPRSGRLAVETTTNGVPTWELLEVIAASETERDPTTGAVAGLLLDVQNQAPVGDISFSAASGNVVRVRHGVTTSGAIGSGDAVTQFRTLSVPDEPVAAELGVDGTATNSLALRVDDRLWTERNTLFGAGPVNGFETRVGPDGEIDVRFGDGVDGAIPGSGLNNIRATYRVGGGTTGEVGAGEIDTLLGSLRGVRSVEGAGPTAGGADQPTESQLRRRAPTRARAMDRIVALSDVADLALAFPGVSHARSWLGESPPGSTGGPGPTVAILRFGTAGVRAALAAELTALSKYLDARRDTNVPLSVTSGTVVPVAMAMTVVADAVFDAATIESELSARLLDPEGVLAATNRGLGEPLDRSDVVRLVHSVEGVIGLQSLTLSAGGVDASSSTLGRLLAERYELLVTDPPSIQVVFS